MLDQKLNAKLDTLDDQGAGRGRARVWPRSCEINVPAFGSGAPHLLLRFRGSAAPSWQSRVGLASWAIEHET